MKAAVHTPYCSDACFNGGTPTKVACMMSLTQQVLDVLSYSPDKNVRSRVAYNHGCDGTTLDRLIKDSVWEVKAGVLTNPSTPVHILSRVAENGNWSEKSLVAENPSAAGTFEKLASYENWDICVCIAANRSSPAALLDKLAHLPNVTQETLAEIAKNPSAAENTLNWLAEQNSERIFQNLAKNPESPDHILKMLSGKLFRYAHLELAENPGTPPEILEKLSEDSYYRARFTVAGNKNCPVSILEKLAGDTESWVIRAAVADNEKTPAHVLEVLAEDDNLEVVCSVAENPNTPVETVKRLSEHEEKKVRLSVTFNRLCPVNLLVKLAQDQDETVANMAATHKKAPAELIEQAVQYIQDDVLSIHMISKMLNIARIAEKLVENQHSAGQTDNKTRGQQLYTLTLALTTVDLHWAHREGLHTIYAYCLPELRKHSLTTAQQLTLQKAAADQGWETQAPTIDKAAEKTVDQTPKTILKPKPANTIVIKTGKNS